MAGRHQGRATSTTGSADLLLKKLDVKPSRESSVIEINFSSENPQFAALIANTFADAYIETNLDLRIEPAKAGPATGSTNSWACAPIWNRHRKSCRATSGKKASLPWTSVWTWKTPVWPKLSSLVVGAEPEGGKRVAPAPDDRIRQSRQRCRHCQQSALIQNLKADLARSEAKLSELSSRLGRNPHS